MYYQLPWVGTGGLKAQCAKTQVSSEAYAEEEGKWAKERMGDGENRSSGERKIAGTTIKTQNRNYFVYCFYHFVFQ